MRQLGATTFCLASILIVMLFFIGTMVSGSELMTGAVPGKYIVKLKAGAKSDHAEQVLSQQGRVERLTQLRMRPDLAGASVWGQYIVYYSANQDESPSTVASLVGSSNVEFVEQDRYLEFFDFPSDPHFSNQWYLNNLGQKYLGMNRLPGVGNDTQMVKQGVVGKDIHVARYYQTPPTATTKVVVAIVDTGADLKHPDLSGRFWRNLGETPGNGRDDDHNGFVDDTLGYDVSGDIPTFLTPTGDNDPTDIVGHGTHIAGIIGSKADGRGVVGVIPWAELMIVKIRPNASNAVAAAGLMYAVNSGAQVISVSWGTPYESLVLKDAIDFARRNGVFIAIAAGNTGKADEFYPASFDSTFAVAAGNSSGFVTSFSTYGRQISVVAPGQDILSLRAQGTDMYAAGGEAATRIVGPDSLYYLSDGTSMAAPMVASAAAFLLSLRPDLNLRQVEGLLRMGADDMLDPLDRGDTLVGRDSISGYGSLNVERSVDLLTQGGIAIAEPQRHGRYSGETAIVLKRIAGYTGAWRLEFGLGTVPDSWQVVTEGSSFSVDSIVVPFDHPELNGLISLRVSDDFGNYGVLSITYVNETKLKLTSPLSGEMIRFSTPISGSAHGLDYDSVEISYRTSRGTVGYLLRSSREFFDTLLYTWNVSAIDTGSVVLYLKGYFGAAVTIDSSTITVVNAYAAGWPQPLPGRASLSPVAADLDGDGRKEIIEGTTAGMYVFRADGTLFPGFPILREKDMRCIPAVYDVDGDHSDDIICCNEDGIHVFRADGTYVPGWPVSCVTGWTAYGYPNPTVARLTRDGNPTILIVNEDGQVLAYRSDGHPYFYSLGGKFALLGPDWTGAYRYGGNFITSADLNNDGLVDVVASLSSLSSKSGTAVFDGRTGQPFAGLPQPQVVQASISYGGVLADLNGDSLAEIIACGYGADRARTIWVKTQGTEDLPGWPVTMPEISGWRGTYPIVADLDLDGSPEVLCTFMEFDIGSLYVFRSNGTPYRIIAGRPRGEVFQAPMTFGNPIVANITGDQYPEIIFRGGYALPSTGSEKLIALDYEGALIPGWPVATSAKLSQVISSPYAPLIDDVDGDGLVEMILAGDANEIFVWDLEASSEEGKNFGRILGDNFNSSIYGLPNTIIDTSPSQPNVPVYFDLTQNYPNPFNSATRIAFALPEQAHAVLDVFNVLGQKVATPLNVHLPAGKHYVDFDGATLASGVYFYRLKAGPYQEARKMVLLK